MREVGSEAEEPHHEPLSVTGRTKTLRTLRRRDEVALSAEDDDEIKHVALDDAMYGGESPQQIQAQAQEQTHSHLHRAVKHLDKESAGTAATSTDERASAGSSTDEQNNQNMLSSHKSVAEADSWSLVKMSNQCSNNP